MRILRIVDYNPMCNENTADVIIGHFALASTSAANLWDIDEGGFHRDRKAAFMATLYDIEMAVLPSQTILLATGRKKKLFTRAHPRERVREILKKLPRLLPSYFLPAPPRPGTFQCAPLFSYFERFRSLCYPKVSVAGAVLLGRVHESTVKLIIRGNWNSTTYEPVRVCQRGGKHSFEMDVPEGAEGWTISRAYFQGVSDSTNTNMIE